MAIFNKNKKKKHKSSHHFAGESIQSTLHKNLEFTATEQYKLLRTNLEFTVPEGTDARIELPVAGKSITVNGVSFNGDELGAFRRSGRLVFKLHAGKYEIK